MQKISVRQMTMDAMLAAVCAVLGYIAVDMGNIKITFESVPILLGALLFGPLDGALIGGVGTLIYQLLRYGISATTALWIAPYVICGVLVGFAAKRKGFNPSPRYVLVVIVLNELLITALNTGVMYVDSKIYGYYSFVYIFGTLALRIVVCVVKAVAYGAIMPSLLRSIQKRLRISAA